MVNNEMLVFFETPHQSERIKILFGQKGILCLELGTCPKWMVFKRRWLKKGPLFLYIIKISVKNGLHFLFH